MLRLVLVVVGGGGGGVRCMNDLSLVKCVHVVLIQVTLPGAGFVSRKVPLRPPGTRTLSKGLVSGI